MKTARLNRGGDMSIRNILFGLVMILGATAANAELVALEEAIEAGRLTIFLDDDLNGSVIGRNCPTCPSLQITVNRATRAIEQGRDVPLQRIRERAAKGATVIYDVKTMTATKIIW
jgi:hypothetical protein